MYVYTHGEKAKNSSLVVNTSIIINITLSLLFSQLKSKIKDKVFGGGGGRMLTYWKLFLFCTKQTCYIIYKSPMK